MKCKTLSVLLGCGLFLLANGSAVAGCGPDSKLGVKEPGCVAPPSRPDIRPPQMPDRPEFKPPVRPIDCALEGHSKDGKHVCKPIMPKPPVPPRDCEVEGHSKDGQHACKPFLPKPPVPPRDCEVEGHSKDGKYACKPSLPKPPVPPKDCGVEGHSKDGKYACKPLLPKPPFPCGKGENGKVGGKDCIHPRPPKLPPGIIGPCKEGKGDCLPPPLPEKPVDPCKDKPCIHPQPVQSNLPD